MGKKENTMSNIDAGAMRSGVQLNRVKMEYLEAPVIEVEIFNALKGIEDLKETDLNGFGAHYFSSVAETLSKLIS